MSSDIIEYEVLYYKRTNKVHKSKGVTKSDGVLKIDPKLHKVSLYQEVSTDAFSAAVASSISKELAGRNLQQDDTIVVGAFEVQIGSRIGATADKPTPLTSTDSTMKRVAAPLLQKSFGIQLSRPLMQRTAPKQPVKRAAILPKQPLANKQLKTTPTSDISSVPQQPSVATREKPVLLSRKILPATAGVKRSSISMSTKPTTAVATSQTANPILPHIPLPVTLAQTLRPHQVTGVDFLWNALLSYKGAILADEMGLGKTLMTIAVIAAMHRQDRTKQFIVVCPSSLVHNWANEFDKWIGKAGSPKRVVLKKGGEDGLAQIKAYCSKMKQASSSQNGQVLIISYDLLRLKAAEQFQNMSQSFKLLVVDEGHRLKNTAGSLTLTALESIPCDARLCITATPIQNTLSEFYTIANFCCPGCLGDLTSFRRNYERPIAASSGPDASRQQRQAGAIQSMELDKITKTFILRRLQKDVLQSMLPPRSEFLLFCLTSPQQALVYRSITDETQIESANAEALTKLTLLRKLCVHPGLCNGYIDDAGGWSLVQSGKLVVVDSLLKAIRTLAPLDKVVLVSNFTSALSVVEKLILQPREYTFIRLDGTTNVQNRQSLIDSYNRASPDAQFCMLLSAKAGGVGLNIVGANRLILLDADWNPAIDIQTMGRVYRQGQTKPTFIYRFFTSGTIEEVIYQRQTAKGSLADMAVDGKASSSYKGFTKEELADCFTLKEHCSCDTKRKIGNQWPEYTGPDSLDTDDSVLLELVSDMSDRLGHVQVVKQDEQMIDCKSEVLDQGSLYDTDEEHEMEFE